MKEYNRKTIQELDPRQCVYIEIHEDGCADLLINGKNIYERNPLSEQGKNEISKVLEEYPDREAYLWQNKRGWTIVLRTETNESMFKWDQMNKLQ